MKVERGHFKEVDEILTRVNGYKDHNDDDEDEDADGGKKGGRKAGKKGKKKGKPAEQDTSMGVDDSGDEAPELADLMPTVCVFSICLCLFNLFSASSARRPLTCSPAHTLHDSKQPDFEKDDVIEVIEAPERQTFVFSATLLFSTSLSKKSRKMQKRLSELKKAAKVSGSQNLSEAALHVSSRMGWACPHVLITTPPYFLITTPSLSSVDCKVWTARGPHCGRPDHWQGLQAPAWLGTDQPTQPHPTYSSPIAHLLLLPSSPQKDMVDGLAESKIMCPSEDKDLYLWYLLLKHPGRTLVGLVMWETPPVHRTVCSTPSPFIFPPQVFVNSIDCVRRLISILSLLNIQPLPLHAQMQQRQRLKNLDRLVPPKKRRLSTPTTHPPPPPRPFL